MTDKLSASGARIRGDDYQHLFAWCQAVRAISPASTIAKIGIEDPNAGNADDVTVYMQDGGCEYYQLKSSVDARKPAGIEWLIESPNPRRSSILQGFYRLWAGKHNEHKLKITLVTNRLPHHADPLMSMIDGRDDTVEHRLQQAEPKSQDGRTRSRLAEHLGITEEETVLFFRDICFMLGRTDEYWKQYVKQFMCVAGLRHDDDAVSQGMGIVRDWVTGGKREIARAELRQAVEPLKQLDDSPTASILIQMIDRDPVPMDATITFDWLDLFQGDEPKVRRLPSDSALWNARFRPELQQAARKLRSQGHVNVLVRGYMRLPTWFAVGAELGKTAGFQVSSFYGQEAWPSMGELSSIPIQHDATTLEFGHDLAVGIALAYDLSKDVLAYIRARQIPVGGYVRIHPTTGASNQVICNASEARGWAFNVRDSIRSLVREYTPDQIHLFLSGPHGAMLLLGHLWDCMPQTQIYEYLGPTKGYAPSYLIPG